MKISSEKEIYNILPEELRNEYTIGFHGFNTTYWTEIEKGKYQLDQKKIQQAKEGILKKGLGFPKGRTLLSTTRFNELSSYVSSVDTWTAGGVIIALPKILKNSNNAKIFIGGPNEKNVRPYWDRNTEPTSLSEIILPEDGVLDPIFIIGSYTKTEKGIDVTLNPKHIAFNKGIVSDEFFDSRKARFEEIMSDRDPILKPILAETSRQKKEYHAKKVISLTKLGKSSYQHQGTKIGVKLKGLVSDLKNNFFGKEEIQEETQKNGEEK